METGGKAGVVGLLLRGAGQVSAARVSTRRWSMQQHLYGKLLLHHMFLSPKVSVAVIAKTHFFLTQFQKFIVLLMWMEIFGCLKEKK